MGRRLLKGVLLLGKRSTLSRVKIISESRIHGKFVPLHMDAALRLVRAAFSHTYFNHKKLFFLFERPIVKPGVLFCACAEQGCREGKGRRLLKGVLLLAAMRTSLREEKYGLLPIQTCFSWQSIAGSSHPSSSMSVASSLKIVGLSPSLQEQMQTPGTRIQSL